MDMNETPNKGDETDTYTGTTNTNRGVRNMDELQHNETRTTSGARIQVTAIGQTRYGRSGNATDSFRMVVGIDLLTGEPVGGVPVAECDLIDIATNLGYDVTGFIAIDETDGAETTARDDGAGDGTARRDDDARTGGGDETDDDGMTTTQATALWDYIGTLRLSTTEADDLFDRIATFNTGGTG